MVQSDDRRSQSSHVIKEKGGENVFEHGFPLVPDNRDLVFN